MIPLSDAKRDQMTKERLGNNYSLPGKTESPPGAGNPGRGNAKTRLGNAVRQPGNADSWPGNAKIPLGNGNSGVGNAKSEGGIVNSGQGNSVSLGEMWACRSIAPSDGGFFDEKRGFWTNQQNGGLQDDGTTGPQD
jgi:hypothetical protein